MKNVSCSIPIEELESERAAFECACPVAPYAEWDGRAFVYKNDKLRSTKPLAQHEFEIWLVARGKAKVSI